MKPLWNNLLKTETLYCYHSTIFSAFEKMVDPTKRLTVCCSYNVIVVALGTDPGVIVQKRHLKGDLSRKTEMIQNMQIPENSLKWTFKWALKLNIGIEAMLS